ncbi:MAG TPA: hypothetical protein VGG33_22220 [Polyangia bacterium]
MGVSPNFNKGSVFRALVLVALMVGAVASYRQALNRRGFSPARVVATASVLVVLPPAVKDSAELLAMFREDQADRILPSAQIDWPTVTARDKRRREEVQRMLATGRVVTALDHYHAAMIYQHGPKVEDSRKAHELALRSMQLDGGNRRARWLVAASKDRELIRLGQPQRYGTQFRQVRKGFWELYPVMSGVSDDERFRYGVSSLATMRSQIAVRNAGGKATLLGD